MLGDKFTQQMVTLFQVMASAQMNPDEVRWLYIKAALTHQQNNVSATARRLGMHRRTLQRIIAAHK